MDKGKTKILLIEDDETIWTILTSILLYNGYAVVPCEEGSKEYQLVVDIAGITAVEEITFSKLMLNNYI